MRYVNLENFKVEDIEFGDSVEGMLPDGQRFEKIPISYRIQMANMVRLLLSRIHVFRSVFRGTKSITPIRFRLFFLIGTVPRHVRSYLLKLLRKYSPRVNQTQSRVCTAPTKNLLYIRNLFIITTNAMMCLGR